MTYLYMVTCKELLNVIESGGMYTTTMSEDHCLYLTVEAETKLTQASYITQQIKQ